MGIGHVWFLKNGNCISGVDEIEQVRDPKKCEIAGQILKEIDQIRVPQKINLHVWYAGKCDAKDAKLLNGKFPDRMLTNTARDVRPRM